MTYHKKEESEGEVIRVRFPKEGEQMGRVIKLLGNCKMHIKCEDGKVRLGRIPGSKRRRMWIRMNDFVIIKPWETQGDTRCDIIYNYPRSHVDWLRRRGKLKKFEEDF